MAGPCAGRHTCLSKALQRGYYTLAEQLLWLGANPNILPSTDLLIGTGFSCKGVRWLIDHTVLASGEKGGGRGTLWS